MVPVGPKSVLFAPPAGDGTHGEWDFIEPSAASLTFLAKDVEATEKQLRELGRQPLTAQTGNLTVVTTDFAAQKGNSAIQAWCLNLKDALEEALRLTCLWLGDSSKPRSRSTPTSPSTWRATRGCEGQRDRRGPARPEAGRHRSQSHHRHGENLCGPCHSRVCCQPFYAGCY